MYSGAASVRVLDPSDGHRMALGDDLALRCRAYYSGLTPPYIGLDEDDFGYRWSLASTADPTQPLKTFGLPGIQGYDRDNRELTVPWSEIDLPMGMYKLTCEARYPPNCLTYAFVQSWDTIDVHITHSLDGIAPGRIVENDTFRVYSNSLAQQLVPGELGVVLIDDDTDPYDDEILQYLVPISEGGYFELWADPQNLPANGGTTYYVRVAEDQSCQ
jgi:hypothetical protein